MLIFVDKRAPDAALKKLERFGEVVPFTTKDLVYKAISGHPDIFITQIGDTAVVAPNLPAKYKTLLERYGVPVAVGTLPVGGSYPASARYNAVVTESFFVHNPAVSDSRLIALTQNKTLIEVKQGYARCNLLAVSKNKWITSDGGIYKTLIAQRQEVLFVRPQGIMLPGFKHGFVGGTCGIAEGRLFLLGSLKYHIDGEKIKKFIKSASLEVVELYRGPLFDGGSIMFF